MEPLCKPSALILLWFVNEPPLFKVACRVLVELSGGSFFDNRFPRPAKRASDFSAVKIIRQIGPPFATEIPPLKRGFWYNIRRQRQGTRSLSHRVLEHAQRKRKTYFRSAIGKLEIFSESARLRLCPLYLNLG